MSVSKWTSIKVVYDKILRDPIFNGISYESIVDYFIDFIDIVGCPNLFEQKIITDVQIVDYRALLPMDFVEEVSVAVNKYPDNTQTRDYKIGRYNPDTHALFNKDINNVMEEPLLRNVVETTYRIAGDYVYFPIETGVMILVYKAIKTDDDDESQDYGMPMLPDDPVFILALQSYIEVQWIRMLVRAGKMSANLLDEAKQTYAWNVGRYETHSKKLNLGEMESLSKMFRSIYQKNNEFATRFRNLGVR